MEVASRQRSSDAGTKKIKRLLNSRKTQVKPKVNELKTSSSANEHTTSEIVNQQQKPVVCRKRKSDVTLESQKPKLLKMDPCHAILSKLMKHKLSLPFLHPVDQDASGDYYQKIKRPMDFQTINQKLHCNHYTDPKEFEDDVTRVFTNAMLYHASNSWIHLYATKLQRVFDLLWAPLKAKPITEAITNVKDDDSSQSEKVIPVPLPKQADVSIGDKIAAAKLAHAAKLDKQRRQQAREDAREALRKMEPSIDFTDNLALMRDLEGLLGCNPSKINLRTNNPMEQFGYYLKPEYMPGDDDEELLQETDSEEGEVSI